MKIMRMFNEVSSKQQEMEIKFELIKRTLKLLKKYERFDVAELEAKFISTPVRWTNLKSKVTLAKQRLGPTIQEESKLITQDLKKFAVGSKYVVLVHCSCYNVQTVTTIRSDNVHINRGCCLKIHHL